MEVPVWSSTNASYIRPSERSDLYLNGINNAHLFLNMSSYLLSGHFLQSTFENWESEFLQMALFLILSMFLYQKGSSESKDPDKKEEVDREPNPKRKNAPWPVKKVV